MAPGLQGLRLKRRREPDRPLDRICERESPNTSVIDRKSAVGTGYLNPVNGNGAPILEIISNADP